MTSNLTRCTALPPRRRLTQQAVELGAKIADADKDFALGVIEAWTPPKAAAKK